MSTAVTRHILEPARFAKPLWWSLCSPRATLRRWVGAAELLVFGRKPFVTPLSYNWPQVRRMVRDFREVAPRLRGRVADLGAGASPYFPIVGAYAERYIAFDFPGSLSSDDPRPIAPVCGDLEHTPLADASLDGAFCAQVLTHVRRPHAVAAEIARVLRPGGALVLTASFVAPLQCEPYDFVRFTPDGIAALLEDAGLRIVDRRTQGDLFTSIALAIAMSLLLSRKRDGQPPHLSRVRQWLFAPLLLALNLSAVALDAILPFNRMPTGTLIVAERPITPANRG